MPSFWGKKKEGEPEEEAKEEKKAEEPPAPASPEGGAAPPKDAAPPKEGEWIQQEDEAGRLGLTAEERAAQLEAEEAAAPEEKAPEVAELVLKLEKVEGRLEATEQARVDMADRLQRMSEQIGELRTIALERERTMGVLEADFELIKSVFEEVKPSEIGRELERKEKSITQLGVRVEKVERVLDRFTEEVRAFRETLDRIKGVENLVEMGQKLKEQADRSDEAKKYIDRMAAKVESIFGELSSRLMTLDTTLGKIEGLEEFSRDATKALDEVGTKMKGLAAAEELRNFPSKEEFKQSLAEIRKSLDERLAALTSGVEGVRTGLQEGLQASAREMAELETRLRKVERPTQAFLDEVEAVKKRLLALSTRLDLETLLKERERIMKEGGDPALLASVEAQIEDARTLGRIMRVLEEHGEILGRLAKAALVDEESLKRLREKIRSEDLAELKQALEERIRRIEIPKEVRKSLQREVAAEVGEAVKEELRRAELLLDKKLEAAERLRRSLEEAVASIPDRIQAALGEVRTSLDAQGNRAAQMEKELTETRARIEVLAGQFGPVALRIDGFAQDLARLRARGRSTEELLREKETLLATLDALKMKHEAGILSRDVYEATLKQDLDRLAEIDGRLEEATRLEEARRRAEAAERGVKELADICRGFPTRDDLDKALATFRAEETERMRARLEESLADGQRSVEGKLAELRLALQRLSDHSQKLVGQEALQSAFSNLQKEVLQRVEVLSESRFGRLQADAERREARLREELDSLRRETLRKLDRLPVEMESRFMEVETRIRDEAQVREALERRLSDLHRELAFLQQRNHPRSLDDLQREREKLLSVIQGAK